MRALYLGRFNPPHIGHQKVLEYILDQQDIDEIIVLIGSGEKAYSLKNPFTGGERVEMMTKLVQSSFDLSKFYIIAIPDINRNTIWPAHVIDLVPPFDVIYTNNSLVQQLFQNLSNKQVRETPLIERDKYSGKIIRNNIVNGKKWKHLVPSEVYSLIKKYGGVERIIALTVSDEVIE